MLSTGPKPILVAFIVVLLAHLVLFMIPVVFDQNKSIKESSILKLTLRRPPSLASLPKKSQEQSVDSSSREQTQIELPDNTQRAVAQSVDQPVQQPREETGYGYNLDRDSLVRSVVRSIQEKAAQPTPRGFGLPSHQSKPEPQYRRRSLVPRLIASNAANRSSISAAGQSTDLVRSVNGKSACWQQRGIPGEAQQWYRVPLALCGHLASAQ